jgi:serine/threonine protein kinase
MEKDFGKVYTLDSEVTESNVIYDSMIGNSVITLHKTKAGSVFVQKRILKDRLVSDEMRADAMRECMICSQLNHPNIVTFYDCNTTDHYIDINLEYLNKHDYLRKRISEVPK